MASTVGGRVGLHSKNSFGKHMLNSHHLQGSEGSFFTLMTMYATDALQSLGLCIHCKHTVHHGGVKLRIEQSNALGNTLAYIIEMRGVATDYTGKGNIGISPRMAQPWGTRYSPRRRSRISW